MLDTIYLIHHSHTDIGYTHDQPIVWEAQRRFIDAVIDACERSLDDDGDHALRWTAETTGVLVRWLRTAGDRQVERLLRLEKAGRVEVTGMFANITPLYDTDQLIESLQWVGRLRSEYGIRVQNAMNCDVNGQNWPLVDALLDAGITGFSMAINEHFGGAPFLRPNVFWWEGPSGRRLLTLNGFHYMAGLSLGIGRDPESLREKLPKLYARLQSAGWPFPFVPIQTTHPFGDNGSIDRRLSDFIKDWNERVERPRIRMATPSMWWQAVREFKADLPVHRGDWTDYWNFGSISSAREQAINRRSRSRLRTADQVLGFVEALQGGELNRLEADLPGRGGHAVGSRAKELRGEAWEALNLWDEHTWGADISVRHPEDEDTHAQWYHKARYAYDARSASLLLARDAVAELSLGVPREEDDALLIYNPLPWPRTVSGPVSGRLLDPRGLGDDPAASRHFQDRSDPAPARLLKPVEVPATGYAVVKKDQIVDGANAFERSEAGVVENHRHRITFDRERGGIVSWWDKELGRELVDREVGLPLAATVHESVADRAHQWPRHLLWRGRHALHEIEPQRGWRPDWRAKRNGPVELTSHTVRTGELGIEVTQTMRVPGIHGDVQLKVFLPVDQPWVEFASSWTMGLETHPEATYVAFPFAVPGATARFDAGGQAVVPGEEQLPGSCRDYFTVQGWVDFSNAEFGVTVACPDNPMVQLGDFTFGRNFGRFELGRAFFLGWVTNNYWETNFRAHQPGQVAARYRVLPHSGGFREAEAHRFGLEAAVPPAMQSAFEPARPGADLPRSGSLLKLPEPPVLAVHAGPAWALATPGAAGSLFLRLTNASDGDQAAEIGPGILAVEQAARCDLFGRVTEPLEVRGGGVAVTLSPRETATIMLKARRA